MRAASTNLENKDNSFEIFSQKFREKYLYLFKMFIAVVFWRTIYLTKGKQHLFTYSIFKGELQKAELGLKSFTIVTDQLQSEFELASGNLARQSEILEIPE